MFDPFGDYDSAGYLRNNKKEKDLKLVKILEQFYFRANLKKAIDYISKVKDIKGEHLFQVHKILFGGLYPWAGLDRQTLAQQGLLPSNLYIYKGNTHFLHPSMILHSLEYTLTRANDPKMMNNSPGTILGELAYIHPFLDGNGRTLLVVLNELCRRAGYSIDWSKTNKKDYLEALTIEIKDPQNNVLSNYLLQFKAKKMALPSIEKNVNRIKGLDGSERFKTFR